MWWRINWCTLVFDEAETFAWFGEASDNSGAVIGIACNAARTNPILMPSRPTSGRR